MKAMPERLTHLLFPAAAVGVTATGNTDIADTAEETSTAAATTAATGNHTTDTPAAAATVACNRTTAATAAATAATYNHATTTTAVPAVAHTVATAPNAITRVPAATTGGNARTTEIPASAATTVKMGARAATDPVAAPATAGVADLAVTVTAVNPYTEAGTTDAADSRAAAANEGDASTAEVTIGTTAGATEKFTSLARNTARKRKRPLAPRGRDRNSKPPLKRREPPTKKPPRDWAWLIAALLYGLLLGRHLTSTALVLKGARVGGEEYAFDALKCDNSHALARYSGRQFCNTDRIKTDAGVPKRVETGEHVIVQKNPELRFQGARCQKKKSSITAVCGAFGHSKIVEPLDVREPVRLSLSECGDVVATQILTTEDGKQIRIIPGTEVTYKYLDTGEVTLSEGNVGCEGGELKIAGKKHSNIVEFVTITYKVTQVEVTEVGGRLKIDEGLLAPACAVAYGGCSLEDMTLVIDAGKVNRCPYGEVRRTKFQGFQYQGKEMMISDEHKILVEVKEEVPLPADCRSRGQMRRTNFDRLFLFSGGPGPDGPTHIQSQEVDLELETRVTDFYMEYWTLSLTMEDRAEWQSEFCELAATRLTEEQIVLHGDHLLRMKGEIIHEFKCEWVVVTSTAGYKADGDRCLDHLPVFTAQRELSYLAPITRILTPRAAVSTLNCSTNFPITVEDKQGRMITANPAVVLVEVEMSEYHNRNGGDHNHTELFDVKSLLYTTEEVSEYEQMLLGPGGERAVTRQFSSYYCQATGECSPSRNTQDFKWQQILQEPSRLLTGWWEDAKEWMLWWGAMWGCFECVLTIGQFLLKMWAVLGRKQRGRLDRAAMMRLVFMPGQELVNMFPPRSRGPNQESSSPATEGQEMRRAIWDEWNEPTAPLNGGGQVSRA